MVTRVFQSVCALAALGVLLTSCSKIRSEVAPKDQVITLSATLSLCDEPTKALSGDGVKTFAAGEQVAVIYTNASDRTVKATSAALTEDDISNEGKTARLTVTITNPKAGTVDYVYPAAMANEDGSMASISAQDGTLETISSKYDYARGSGLMSVGESDATLPSDVELSNPLVICKFSLNCEGTDVTDGITALTITSGEDSYHINRTAGEGPIFVALKPVSGADLSFAATDGTKYYAKAVYGKTLEGGKMVPITLNMNAVAAYTSYIRHGWDADARTVTSETVVESAKHLNEASPSAYASLSGTWYVTGTLDIASQHLKVAPNKTLNLVLCDGAHLKAKSIWLDHTGILRIFAQTEGTGKATIISGNNEAAIGLESDTDGGTVEIHGGVISAKCTGYYGAGIGSSDSRYMTRIAIYDGTITAEGRGPAAGIGRSSKGNDGGSIDIYGGKITAIGGSGIIETTGELDGGAGIGDGNGARRATSSIRIYGGTIEATGGYKSAGIGAGNGKLQKGFVGIYGGKIIATGSVYAAGITSNTIDIQGGDISAYAGEDGAGIGSGQDINNGTITITGGTVRAYGNHLDNSYGAGIGGGQNGSGGTITISGGTVYAYGGIDAAGIGSGEEEIFAPNTNSGNITITGGFVRAVGKSYGAGIGAGEYSDCLTVTINTSSGNPLTVEAISGEDCGSAGSIGSNDPDRFGTLIIGDRVKVQTYSSSTWSTLETNVNRPDKVHRIRQAKLSTCDHPGYTPETCPYCTH